MDGMNVNDTQVTQEQQGNVSGEETKLFAGKFKTTNDLEKAYLELQKYISQTRANPTPSPASTQATTSVNSNDSGIIADMLMEEIAATGGLSKSGAELARQNKLDMNLIERAALGLKAQRDIALKELGGQEELTKMIEWAKVNLSAREKELLNPHLVSGDPEKIRAGVELIRRAQQSAGGVVAPSVGGTTSSSGDVISGTTVIPYFKSEAEYTKFLMDNKVDMDRNPAFRGAVRAQAQATMSNWVKSGDYVNNY